MIPDVLLHFHDFLSLKTNINVVSKSNKQKYLEKKFSCHLKDSWRKQQDPELESDPNQLVTGTDPRIWIRTKNGTDRQHCFIF